MATLSFWGAVGTVTGSKYLVQTRSSRILVDCGIFQGLKALRERNWQEPPFDPRSIDAVVLTHAHIDHTGYLPRLVAQGFDGPIFCSRATAQLTRILLPDSGRLQEEEADYRNRHNLTNHEPALPLYTEEDADAACRLLRPVPDNDDYLDIVPEIRARFYRAGHLLGARFVSLEVEGEDGNAKHILFSGDIGSYDRPILPDPEVPPSCDYLLVESTYGDRLHPTDDTKETLAAILNEAYQHHSPVLIPAFAIGRTQDILYTIRELEDEKRIPIMTVNVDSPMAAEATQVYIRMVEEHDEAYAMRDKPLRTHQLNIAAKKDESKRLNSQIGARVIISAAGMMNGGRILHHAQRMLPDPNAVILFVGFQAEGTLGRRILNGDKEVKVFKEWTPVHCKVKRIEGFSGHADWKGILRWLEGMHTAPKQTFIVHGEPVAADAMRGHIVERFGWNVHLPHYGEKVELI